MWGRRGGVGVGGLRGCPAIEFRKGEGWKGHINLSNWRLGS